MSYVAGWDGGGSKTAVICLDFSGKRLIDESFGPLNPNGADIDSVRRTIRSALSAMAALPGGIEACRSLVIGTAGLSNPKAEGFITELVRDCGYSGPLHITGDHEILLYGAVGQEGAVLIAGTGSICIGRNSMGAVRRSGGLGYLIGDEGSGYWIGLRVLSAVTRALDGRGTATGMTKPLLKALHCDDLRTLVSKVYGGGLDKSAIAALSSVLMNAMREEDPVALDIARRAVDELSLLAGTVFSSLNIPGGPLALSGGLLAETSPLRFMIENRLRAQYPNIVIISPKNSAAYGAAMMAEKLSDG